MRVPLSWIKEFVDMDVPLDELARRLTWAGLEVEEIHLIGLPFPEGTRHNTKYTGLPWEKEKIVVGSILEVHPHPDADRLVLCQLDDGVQIHTVLTGAPSLLPYRTVGKLTNPFKVAYAREGAQIYDGHQSGNVLTRLKRTKIRGVVSYSMVCSEKELGISDIAEDIIYFDDNAPAGLSLVDYIGDAVLEIAITPNIARDANMVGVAREIAALTGMPLCHPSLEVVSQGPSMIGLAEIEILEENLNPRFVLGLIQNVEIKPSPPFIQRRLRLAGMRPINNIVDATNYVMLELGQPLHAFDYDILSRRAGGKPPKIITRAAHQGEKLVTLDGVERSLDDFTVVVCDTKGILALAGVMGGEESEVTGSTHNVLLEGATWNYVNTRKTTISQKLISEAAYRFARGVHPAMALRGVLRALELMRLWSGGVVANGVVDQYPLPAKDATVEISPRDVKRWLGIDLSAAKMGDLLMRLEFAVEMQADNKLHVTVPDHRLDIGDGVIGKADLMEEIARIYGYENIPETRMDDELPPQRSNPIQDFEEKLKNILVRCGLQEVVSYRMTTPENEARLFPKGTNPPFPYISLSNPISNDRTVLRRSLLSSVMESLEHNVRVQSHLAFFEIGSVFIPINQPDVNKSRICDEPTRLAIALTGPRILSNWQSTDTTLMDYFDLKGIIETLLDELHIKNVRFETAEHPTFHPAKCARIWVESDPISQTDEIQKKKDNCSQIELGFLGELHPMVKSNFNEFPITPVIAADLDVAALRIASPDLFILQPIPSFPPVLEDLAFVVADYISASQIADLIQQSGGETVTKVRLFDEYRGEKVGECKKSLAYSLTYQAKDRTLTDDQVAKVRNRIIQRMEKEIGAKLRS